MINQVRFPNESPSSIEPAANDSVETPLLTDSPSPAPWGGAAIRLLQGVIYHDDPGDAWNNLLNHQAQLNEYFGVLGLQLIVDETDGMAYLKQPADDQLPSEFQDTPRLFRRTPLGYETSLLAVLLRDQLRQFEEEDLQNERCIVAQHDLLELWQAFFPESSDAAKLQRTLQVALRKLEDLKFVRQFEKQPSSWEIRRILKARLPLDELERLRQSLVEAVSHHD